MLAAGGPLRPAPQPLATPGRPLRRTKAVAAPASTAPPSTPRAAALAPRRPPAAGRPPPSWVCRARRRVRYGGGDEEEEQGHNWELALVESFSAAARGQAFLVRATVDGEEETVLVFRVSFLPDLGPIGLRVGPTRTGPLFFFVKPLRLTRENESDESQPIFAPDIEEVNSNFIPFFILFPLTFHPTYHETLDGMKPEQ